MYLGFDIGTTKICAIVLNNDGNITFSGSCANENLIGKSEYEKIQDADAIVDKCFRLYSQATSEHAVESIGISTQMHGMLYFDKDGNAVSPLYTWQDERGNLPFSGSTYVQRLSAVTGFAVASGFGLASLYYDLKNHAIPATAAGICTIGDYLAMKLTGSLRPVMHESNAASYGLFDIREHCWKHTAIRNAGIPSELLPDVTSRVAQTGTTRDGIPVFCCIGDNQASVYGALQSDDDAVINIGTGSQISVVTSTCDVPEECEIRPYFGGKKLLLGSPLCGGYSYELLKNFFNSVTGGKVDISYETMNAWALQAQDENLPKTVTTFKGTRANPLLRASVAGLDVNNFNAQSLTRSLLKGISDELLGLYVKITESDGKRRRLIASGNGIRRNKVLREIISRDFGMPLLIPENTEEAAFGAAVIAAEAECGQSLKHFVRYGENR